MMTLSQQTTIDLKAMIETLDQRIHELTCSKGAVNSAHPAEVAGLGDLRDAAAGLLVAD